MGVLMYTSIILSLLIACGDGNSETTENNQAPKQTENTTTKTEDKDVSKTTDDANIARKGLVAAPEDVAAPPADAITSASGLAYKVLSKGTGTEKPSAEAKVTVHYTGWTTDGKMFDSSTKSGKRSKAKSGKEEIFGQKNGAKKKRRNKSSTTKA